MLTPKQQQILEFIYQAITSSGYSPSMAELKEKINVASNQSVINLIKALEDRGCVKREEGQARSLRILPLGFKALGKEQIVPIVGTTSAGPFVEGIQTFGNWIELSGAVGQELEKEKFLESRDRVYVVKVQGDSMINAGIEDGDTLLVRETKEYHSGDIVVARTNDGTTVKRFIVDGKKVYLKPENPAYNNIPFFDDMWMDGKVITNLSGLKRLIC